MIEVEKKEIGRTRVGLVICAVLVVVLAVSNVWSHANLQSQVDSLQSQVDALATDKNNLQNEVNSLKAPKLHKVIVGWSDHHPRGHPPLISISGVIFNSGTDSAYNVILTVKIYNSTATLLKSEELIFGTIDGKSYKNFDTDIEYSGNADHILTTLAYD